MHTSLTLDGGRLTSSRDTLLGHLVAFVIPCLMFLEVNLGGRLFGSEMALIIVLPFLMFSHGRQLQGRLPATIFFLGLLWLALQIATDLVRETTLEDFARGWAKIAVFLVNFAAIYLLLRGSPKRILLFGLGVAVGQILDYYISPHEFAQHYPWKFGVGFAITILVVQLANWPAIAKVRPLSAIIVALIGLVNVYLDFRSLGLICLLTAGYMLSRRTTESDTRMAEELQRPLAWPQAIAAVGLLIVVGAAFYWIYGYAAGSGWLGEQAESRYRAQSAGDLGLFLGGRREILASSRAIIDSPIIGHGSWAKDANYVDAAAFLYEQLGYEMPGVTQSELIPTHSYLFGAWVEAGILGALFWIWILHQALKLLVSPNLGRPANVAWVVFGSLLLIWDVMFSPFGAAQRLSAAYFIAVICWTLKQLQLIRNGSLSRP